MRKTEMKDIGEFGFIQRIREKYSRLSGSVVCGIGDDAAALHCPSDHLTLVTTDILIEDIHFTRKSTIPYLLGVKSLAVNLSDIAAMGGIPRFFLLSLGVPRGYSFSFVDRFYQGVSQLAEVHQVLLVGGDIAAAPKLIINGIAIGHCPPNQAVYRKGAQPGDHIFVTGPLGDSALGLEILRQRGLRPRDFGPKGEVRGKDRDLLGLIRRHLAPTPPIHKGRRIAEMVCATAMIDISDGLLADLGHIMRESHVGATVWVDRVPRSQTFETWARHYHPHPMDLALGGGEDYELLFTGPLATLQDALSNPEEVGLSVYPIGEVTPYPEKLSLITKGQKSCLPSRLGYDHFKGFARRRTR